MHPLDFAGRVIAFALAVPGRVTQWGRTQAFNDSLTGSEPDSYHVLWLAVDFIPADPLDLTRPAAAQRARERASQVGLLLVPEGDHWHLQPPRR